MSELWVQPYATPLDEVAPTMVNALLECPRRVAFRRDKRTRQLSRPTTRTALGQVSHRLTELVLKGHAPARESRRAWLESEWDSAIANQAAALATAWPGRPVPAPNQWRGYVATRTRLLRRLENYECTSALGPAIGGGAPRSESPLPWVERKLADTEIGLCGTPDLVEERGGSVRVVDLKSGVHQSEVRESQRRQLLLYAHLVAKALDRAVAEVAIVDVGGRERAMGITAAQIEHAVATAVSAREAFNEAADNGSVPANPSSDACRFCIFKVVCRAYWDARQDDWETDLLVGTVTGLAPPNVATIAHDDKSVRVVLTSGERVKVGDQVAITGLARAGQDTYRLRWDGRIRSASG